MPSIHNLAPTLRRILVCGLMSIGPLAITAEAMEPPLPPPGGDGNLAARVDAIEATVAALQGDLAIEIAARLIAEAALQAQITPLQTDVGTLQTDLTTLTGVVGGNLTAIGNVQGDVGTLQGDVVTLQADVAAVQSLSPLTVSVSADDVVSNLTPGAGGDIPVPDMSQAFQTATAGPAIIWFNGQLRSPSSSQAEDMTFRIRIDQQPIVDAVRFVTGIPLTQGSNETIGDATVQLQWIEPNLPSGEHTIEVFWGAADQSLFEIELTSRSLIVLHGR